MEKAWHNKNMLEKNLISQFAMENSGNKNKNTKFNPGQKETVA